MSDQNSSRDQSPTTCRGDDSSLRSDATEGLLREVFDAALGLTWGEDWNNGHAATTHGHRKRLLIAVGRAGRALGVRVSPQAEHAADDAAARERSEHSSPRQVAPLIRDDPS